MEYKPLKKSKELVEYLEKNKNVSFSDVSKNQALEVLEHYNYINVITPYKHHFAEPECDTNIYESKRDNQGNHIYRSKTDFSEYLTLFYSEKEQYSNYYNAIMQFELAFKTQISYHFIKRHNVVDNKSAVEGFEVLCDRVERIDLGSTGDGSDLLTRQCIMKKQFSKFIKFLSPRHVSCGRYMSATDIYILFDRMNLSDLLTVYYCMKKLDKKIIFNKMKDMDLHLNAKNHKYDFPSKVFNLVSIRNCIMHFNSLEILLKYSDHQNKVIRNPKSREKYIDILKSLNYISRKYTENCNVTFKTNF